MWSQDVWIHHWNLHFLAKKGCVANKGAGNRMERWHPRMVERELKIVKLFYLCNCIRGNSYRSGSVIFSLKNIELAPMQKLWRTFVLMGIWFNQTFQSNVYVACMISHILLHTAIWFVSALSLPATCIHWCSILLCSFLPIIDLFIWQAMIDGKLYLEP